MPLTDRLLNLLLVKPEEVGTLLLLGANLFLATLALIVSQIVAETLFLSAYGGDVLVYIYMVNGFGAVLAGAAYGRFQGRFRAGMFEMGIVMLFAMLFMMAWATIESSPSWMLIVLMVFAEIFGTLIILQAWNTNGALLSSRSAKRLMPLISGFGTIAGILSGVVVGALAKPLGTVNLIGIVIVALVLMTALAYPLAKRLCVSMERIAPPKKKKTHEKQRLTAGAGAVLGNRHIQIILAMTAVATLTSMLVDYQFKVFSQAHFTVDGTLAKDRLSSFYGQLQVVISVLALVLQFGMASRVLERFGIAMTLALLPAVILTGAFGIVLGIGSYFAAATLSRSGDKILKFSLYGSTNQMLFMALPEHLQKTARTLSNAIVRPVTFVFAGVLLIGVTHFAGMNDAAVGWLTGAMALVWIILSVTAERGYLMSMLNMLAHNRIQFHTDQIEITDSEAIKEIIDLFSSDDPDRVRGALVFAQRVRGVDLVPRVIELIDHPDATVRAAATEFLGEHGSEARLPLLSTLLQDSDATVRAKAAQAIFRIGSTDDTCLDPVRPYLDSPDLPVRAVALSFFLASNEQEERRLGNERLDAMAASGDPQERLAALDAIIGQKEQTCSSTVLQALEDPVSEVRCRATVAASSVNCPGVWKVLLQRLAEDRLEPLELVAMGTADASLVPALRTLLLDTDKPIRVRRRAAQILGRIGGDEALEALLERLHNPLLTVPLDTARAATKIVNSQGTPLRRKRVAGALELLYDDAYKIVTALADFEQSALRDHVGLATLVLRRRLRRVMDTMFEVLSLTYPADVIDLAVACLNSSGRKELDTAIEVMNQALEREDRTRVIPLIESESPAASLSAVGHRVTITHRDAEQRIERWLRHADPWRSTAALWTTAEAQLQQLRDKARGHLASDHAVVRETAALATWSIEDPAARRELLEPLRNDPVESIRNLVTRLLDSPPDENLARPA